LRGQRPNGHRPGVATTEEKKIEGRRALFFDSDAPKPKMKEPFYNKQDGHFIPWRVPAGSSCAADI
jgi:hypothetical protein